jgi:hypothetical protein
LNEILWPAVIVAGSERPVIPKPTPEIVARFTTKLTLPEFVKVTIWEPSWPTVTFPKLIEPGDIVRPVCVPVPLSETVRGELAASLVTTTLPETAPPAMGAN